MISSVSPMDLKWSSRTLRYEFASKLTKLAKGIIDPFRIPFMEK